MPKRGTGLTLCCSKLTLCCSNAVHTKKPGLVVKEHLCSLNNQPRLMKKSGGDLLSHRVPPAVPSALRVLASGFGM